MWANFPEKRLSLELVNISVNSYKYSKFEEEWVGLSYGLIAQDLSYNICHRRCHLWTDVDSTGCLI